MAIFSTQTSLLTYNTFGLDATAAYFATWHDTASLVDVVEKCHSRALDFRVLGGGSNTILTGDWGGAIIHPVSNKISAEGDLVVAEAGVEWDKLVGWCVERGLAGLENLSYIPGTVGASPVQNIGAYGAESGDRIEWVEYLDTESMKIERIAGNDCKFGYRESIFKKELKNRAIVIRVAYRIDREFDAANAKLDYGDLRTKVEAMEGGATLRNIRTAVTEIRRSKLPDPEEIGNAGSFFKNPVVSVGKFESLKELYPNIPSYTAPNGVKIPAGWLIERSGWKGYRDGEVGVHDRQALVIVNYGGATAADIMMLARSIQSDVKLKFGIEISMEVGIL